MAFIDIYTTIGLNQLTLHPNTVGVWATLIGGGGGGASGTQQATTVNRSAGGGGGGGAYAHKFVAVQMLSNVVTIDVGRGGVGGGAITINNTTGKAGGTGGNSFFGDVNGKKN